MEYSPRYKKAMATFDDYAFKTLMFYSATTFALALSTASFETYKPDVIPKPLNNIEAVLVSEPKRRTKEGILIIDDIFKPHVPSNYKSRNKDTNYARKMMNIPFNPAQQANNNHISEKNAPKSNRKLTATKTEPKYRQY